MLNDVRSCPAGNILCSESNETALKDFSMVLSVSSSKCVSALCCAEYAPREPCEKCEIPSLKTKELDFICLASLIYGIDFHSVLTHVY